VSNPRGAVAVAAAAAAMSLLVPGTALADRHPADAGYTTKCPPAEALVQGTAWHTHKLAPGVTLHEGKRKDARGHVDMHVLDVDVMNKHVRFAPLVRRLAQRSPLTSLASERAGLVAATNTGYFDYDAGTPLGPVVGDDQPWVSSATGATVVGLSTAGLVQAGHVALAGSVSTSTTSQPLIGLNTVRPTAGVTAYSSKWGRAPVFVPRDAVTRYVSGGRIARGVGQFDSAPASNGFLLVARGDAATKWLTSLSAGTTVRVNTRMTTSAAEPFAQAYAVGSRLVHDGAAQTGMECRRRYPQPARTAIGFANGGKRLILAVIADDPGTPMHGLDADQTARLMHDLGATEAYMFDGSGSTEMLAKLPKSSGLSMRNYPADGLERPMPVGLGIFHR
jgi:hypothetical protein